ncbi:MAG: hypothetical protein EZS28_038053 [Streblomastix strix]|uniref:Uncharacterized protein n=1 Tax=Streblomastix strix TaxID=222440 RepID=A0A5J4U951_9EUKA|nr:MAG: hypothetical protein EZS28_038053 [Streblomastix strix]
MSQTDKDNSGTAPIGVQEKIKKGKETKKPNQQKAQLPLRNQTSAAMLNLQTKTASVVLQPKVTSKKALRSPSGIEEMSARKRTAPLEMEERIGELKYKGKDNGIGVKTKRFIEIQEQIEKDDFINTRFYLRFKDQNSYQRFEVKNMIIPFRLTIKEKEAYQKNVEERIWRRNSNANITEPSKMLESHISDKEIQWNIENDS